MLNYRRVTYEDRCQIQAFLQVKRPVVEIAQRLGFHKSTIYRDLGRYRPFRAGYDPRRATSLAKRGFRRCRRSYKIKGELERVVVERLLWGWSPEQISGRMLHEGSFELSHEAIYQYVERHKEDLNSSLRRYNKRGAGRYRQRKTKLTANKLTIHERPEIANHRLRIGDWERDTMYGAKRKLVLVCTDRKSRYTKLATLKSYRIKAASKVTRNLLKSTGKKVHTITNDNGPEFRDGPRIGIPVYYCDPQKPQQRGTVENTVGLLRQYIQRKTQTHLLTRNKLDNIEDKINFRPRPCLDYLTPYEVFYETRVALAV